MNHSNIDQRLTGIGEPFVIFAESAITPQPAEGPLHHPATRQNHESLHAYRTQHRLEKPTATLLHPLHQRTGISSVGPNELQPGQLPAYLLQNQLGTVTILNVGGMNDDGQKQSQGVHQDVSLPAVDFFFRIVAMWPSLLGRLDRLAVQDGRAGLGLAAVELADGNDKGVMDFFPQASPSPASEVPVDRLPGWETMRQHAPRTTAARHVEDAVNEVAIIIFSGPAAGFGGWEQVFDVVPLQFGQIARVRFSVHALELENSANRVQLAF